MSMPPERVHVKRRRNDEPVDLLCLEHTRPQKRHSNNDFLFARIQSPVFPDQTQTSAKGPEIPIVKATAPGDEVRDEIARQAAQIALREKYQVKRGDLPASPIKDENPQPEIRTLKDFLSGKPRRVFRLQRSHRKPQTKTHYGGIRKRAPEAKRAFATFTETSTRISTPDLDEMVTVTRNDDLLTSRALDEHRQVDLSSDSLSHAQSDEQTENSQKVPEVGMTTGDENMAVDEFVYDTFVRVPDHGHPTLKETVQIGLLVIESEDQELWGQYAESDSDDNWDEEDPDSNAEDNPANDYPDEELSDDDEIGNGAYRHRQYGSDNEEYDLERSYSDEE